MMMIDYRIHIVFERSRIQRGVSTPRPASRVSRVSGPRSRVGARALGRLASACSSVSSSRVASSPVRSRRAGAPAGPGGAGAWAPGGGGRGAARGGGGGRAAGRARAEPERDGRAEALEASLSVSLPFLRSRAQQIVTTKSAGSTYAVCGSAPTYGYGTPTRYRARAAPYRICEMTTDPHVYALSHPLCMPHTSCAQCPNR
jgi:hypothetical protein